MKYYAPENASFLLPFQFNIDRLKQDLEKCVGQFNFLANYIPENYNGKDYILPLRSIGGNIDFGVAVANQKNDYEDTIALKECLYFKKVIDTFLCPKEAVRLMSLPAGKVINTHTDYNCGYEDGIFRIHIPINTNSKVYFILNNQRIIMDQGEVWYTNVNLPHSVANNGETTRVHLVIDCVRNNWSDDLFGRLGYDFTQENRVVEEELSRETILRMIEELSFNKSEGAIELIKKLNIKLSEA